MLSRNIVELKVFLYERSSRTFWCSCYLGLVEHDASVNSNVFLKKDKYYLFTSHSQLIKTINLIMEKKGLSCWQWEKDLWYSDSTQTQIPDGAWQFDAAFLCYNKRHGWKRFKVISGTISGKSSSYISYGKLFVSSTSHNVRQPTIERNYLQKARKN